MIYDSSGYGKEGYSRVDEDVLIKENKSLLYIARKGAYQQPYQLS